LQVSLKRAPGCFQPGVYFQTFIAAGEITIRSDAEREP
jgi:hypothetical protein